MSQRETDQTLRLGTEADVEELKRNLTATIALVLTATGGYASMLCLPGEGFRLGTFAVLASIALEGLASYYLRTRKPIISRAILLLGLTLSLSLALQVVKSPAVPFFAALIVIAVAAINPLLGFAAAILNTVSLCFLLPFREILVPSLAFLWLAAAMAWISSRGLYTALQWAWNSQQRATTLLAELRQRRGELNRTLFSLTEATSRLARTNKELAIARQQADEARVLKEQFVANVSHELRTPLNLIVGFAEVMCLVPETYEGVTWTPDLMSDIGRMYRASRHLQGLVNDVLDLSRIDVARLPMFRELADIRSIIQEVGETVSPLLQQRGLSYEATWPQRLPDLFVDRTRIRQVMLNLLNNAVRFTDTGGISVRIEEAEDALVVSVHDTGIGVPRDQLESIFESFHQVESGLCGRGGVGLGLAISRQFVEMHGGRLWVESEVGVGSTFHFSLPLPGSLPQTASLRRTPIREPGDYSEAPVIMVDPDPSIADMLGRYLGDHPVLAASDTGEAEKLIEAKHPVAVIVNNLPEAPVERWLGVLGDFSQRYSVPILRCSIPSPSWLQSLAGLDGCLTKPVSRESLKVTLERHCRQPSTILVVDDDPDFLSLMSRMLGTLQLAGEVLTCCSGAEALRIAQERHPHLVLLDLLMPDLDGFGVVEALRQDPAFDHTVIVAVTATSYAEQALLRSSGYFTITQSRGLTTGTLTELLKSAIQVLQPSYVEVESTSSSA